VRHLEAEHPSRLLRRLRACLTGLLAVVAAASPLEADVINRIVLRVNDRIATLQDYELRRAQLLADLGQADLDEETRRKALGQLSERVYRDMFEELLLQSRADQLDIRVSERTLEEVIKSLREDMGVPDEAAFEIALAQSGMTVPEFRERWRENLRMREVVGLEVTGKIVGALNEDALRRIYRDQPERFRSPEQVRLREVVVLDTSSLSAEERATLAAQLQAAMASGEGFEELLAERKEAGELSGIIELGWVRPGELAADLEKVAFGLPVGGVSEPVPARGGHHVIQLLERRESRIQPFEEVSDAILRQERERLFPQRYREYLTQLEESSHIVLAPPPGAASFRQVEGSLAEEVKDAPVPAAAQDQEAGEEEDQGEPPGSPPVGDAAPVEGGEEEPAAPPEEPPVRL
jgi:peptidyl-prolyl cis-trans isomerase SurA